MMSVPPPESRHYHHMRYSIKERFSANVSISEQELDVLKRRVQQGGVLLTRSLLGTYLKELNMRRHYDNLDYLYCTLTGRELPRVSEKEIDEIVHLAAEIRPYIRARMAELMPGRRNFLSQSLVIAKCIQVLGYDHLQEFYEFKPCEINIRSNKVIELGFQDFLKERDLDSGCAV